MQRPKLISVCLTLLLAVACSGPSQDLNTLGHDLKPISNTAPLGPAQNGGPTQGIQDHQLYFAVSEDGTNWKLSPEESILEKASVPNLLLLNHDVGNFKTGTLISHFVDASEMHDWGDERIGYITSPDNGKTWSDRALITIQNLPEGLTAVDPCVVQLEDGRLRIYFFDFTANKDLLAGNKTTPTFYSAVSSDGVTFEFEGKVYSSDAALITDPEVIWYQDHWLLYNPVVEDAESMRSGEGKIQISESRNGTDFQYLKTIDFSGIPGVLVEDGTVSMFGCNLGGITRVTSTNGTDFDLENEVVVLKAGGCDPDPVQLLDGSYAMMLKKFSVKPS